MGLNADYRYTGILNVEFCVRVCVVELILMTEIVFFFFFSHSQSNERAVKFATSVSR